MRSGSYEIITYLIFLMILGTFFGFCFYETPFGPRIEERLYDLRTRWKPDDQKVDGVVLIESDRRSTELLNPGMDHIGMDGLLQVSAAALRAGARSVNILLPSGLYDIPAAPLASLVDFTRQNTGVRIGVLGFDAATPTTRQLPPAMRDPSLPVYGMDSFRSRSMDSLQRFPLAGYRGLTRRPLLATVVAGVEQTGTAPADILINYIHPDRLRRVSAAELVQPAGRELLHSRLQDQHVFISYSRGSSSPLDRQVSRIKTPWQSVSADISTGIPVMDLMGVVTLNLIHRSWLREAPRSWTVIQTILVTVAFALVWWFGITAACLFMLAVWFGMPLIHGFLFSRFHVFVPLGDTALFSTLSAIMGGNWRLSQDGRLIAAHEANTRSQKELARVQGRFLDQFSQGLTGINEGILDKVNRFGERLSPVKEAAVQGVWLRLLSSCEELRDYLSAIKQFSAMTSDENSRSVWKHRFHLYSVIQRILHQFDSTCEQLNLQVKIQCDYTLRIYSAEAILEPILFNLISNAVKYSPENGRIWIIVEPERRKDVVIRIQDEGPGIAPEFQELIFEKFYRVKDDNLMRIKGNGLGLFLCRFFASKIGATVGLESELGKGSTFWIRIARARR